MKFLITAVLLFGMTLGIYGKHCHTTTLKPVVTASHARRVPAPSPKVPTVEPKKAPVRGHASALPGTEEIIAQIHEFFPEDSAVAVAVFRAESGLRVNAQGWNCHYLDASGRRYSASCTAADRPNAWSTDCGIAQINTPGTVCPAELFDPKVNLERARDKYNARGWQPWSAFTAGKYLAFL